jgi:beta-lactamase regulating signal transducer with metallopeptidase domain
MNTILEQINSTGYAFVEFALPMLAQSSVLIVVLLLADVLLRKKVRAVFRYWLWMLVLLKLVLPTTLSSPISFGSWFGDRLASIKVSDTNVVAQPVNLPQISEMGTPAAASTPAFTPPAGVRPIATPAPDTEPAVAEVAASQMISPASLTWQGIVFLVWVAVVAAMGLLVLQRAIFVRSLVAQAQNPAELMKDVFRFCCGQMGLKGKVGLKVSANATSPAVCGLFRPVILLPQNLAPTLGSSRLRPVLLHELAHISRGDLWVNLVQTILQITYFYNPLLWLANSVIRRIREQAVDEAVQVAMGANARQYPQTLVDVAKLAFNRPALSLRLIGVVESKSQLKRRIKRMLDRPIPKTAKLGVLGLAVILIIGCILLPMAKAAEAKESEVEDTTQFTAKLNNDVTVEQVEAESAVGEGEEEKLQRDQWAEKMQQWGKEMRKWGEQMRQWKKDKSHPQPMMPPMPAMPPIMIEPSAPVEPVRPVSPPMPIPAPDVNVSSSLSEMLSKMLPEMLSEMTPRVTSGANNLKMIQEKKERLEKEIQKVKAETKQLQRRNASREEKEAVKRKIESLQHQLAVTNKKLEEQEELFEEDMEQWSEQFEERMEQWGEQFGGRMEDWAEQFGEKLEEQIEQWVEQFEEQMDDLEEQMDDLDEQLDEQKDELAEEDEQVRGGETSKAGSGAIDVAAEDFRIRPYPAGGLYTVTVAIRNKGLQGAPSFRLNFYRGDPANNLNLHGKPQAGSHGAGPIKPGNVWNESSSPFALKEGLNEIVVVLDTDRSVAESDETNNRASMRVVVKDGRIIKKSVSYASQPKKAKMSRLKTNVQPGGETVIVSKARSKSNPQTKRPAEQNQLNEAVYKQLDEIVDLSKLDPEMPFSEAIEILKNSVDPPLKMFVNWRDLQDNADIDQATPINMDAIPAVRLSLALKLLLESLSTFADIDYVVEDGIVFIATIESLPTKFETSVYDISDLVSSAADAGDIARLVINTVEPESWENNGGGGTLTAYNDKKLIVYQTQRIHKQIRSLLQDLQD